MSELRIEVQPYGDGRVLLTLGGLSLTLAADARDRLREALDRAAMPGQEGSPERPSGTVGNTRASGHPLVESALAIARDGQEAADRDE